MEQGGIGGIVMSTVEVLDLLKGEPIDMVGVSTWLVLVAIIMVDIIEECLIIYTRHVLDYSLHLIQHNPIQRV